MLHPFPGSEYGQWLSLLWLLWLLLVPLLSHGHYIFLSSPLNPFWSSLKYLSTVKGIKRAHLDNGSPSLDSLMILTLLRDLPFPCGGFESGSPGHCINHLQVVLLMFWERTVLFKNGESKIFLVPKFLDVGNEIAFFCWGVAPKWCLYAYKHITGKHKHRWMRVCVAKLHLLYHKQNLLIMHVYKYM